MLTKLTELQKLLKEWLELNKSPEVETNTKKLVKIQKIYKRTEQVVERESNSTSTASNSISASVGARGVNKNTDVQTVQSLLNNHGASLVVDGDCGSKTIAAIQSFQSSKLGVANPDGRVDVGGRTWGALTQSSTSNNSSGSNDSSTQTSAPTTNSISASVGAAGVNKNADVQTVQGLLNNHGASLVVDGDCGRKTIVAIQSFQSSKLGMSNPDGRVDVGGRTWGGLIGTTTNNDNQGNTGGLTTDDSNTTTPATPSYDGETHFDIDEVDETMDNYDRPELITSLNGAQANLDTLSDLVGDNRANKVADVLAVQYYLNRHGYACPQDGQWDNKVSRQLAWFSRSCRDSDVGTTRTCRPGSKLWDYLTGKLDRPETDETSAGYYDDNVNIVAPNHQLTGLVGSGKVNAQADVLAVQKLLNQWGNYSLAEDGLYGSTTGKAIMDFQAQMGITTDGVVGNGTWPYLTGDKDSEKVNPDTSTGKDYGPKPSWIKIAEGEIGVKELPDSQKKVNNPRVMEYHEASGGFREDESAWCASFTSWCLSKAGVSNPRDPGVIQWRGWGTVINQPFYGCVATINSWGHIGFVVGADATNIYMLGGNQSNMVKITKYKKSSVSAYLQPPGYTPPQKAWNIESLDGDYSSGGSTR